MGLINQLKRSKQQKLESDRLEHLHTSKLSVSLAFLSLSLSFSVKGGNI